MAGSTAGGRRTGDTNHEPVTADFAREFPELSLELVRRAGIEMENHFDHRHGGFGGAPKFPPTMSLDVLGRLYFRQPVPGILHMVRTTLDRMYRGGMYDHLGGGFARYSVDAEWLVPHFEKMLYDNGLLANAYLDGYQLCGDHRFATVARETLDYILRDMTDPMGGFYSSEDADSEGVEGKFYVWDQAEIEATLGEHAKLFMDAYGVTAAGNFEGHNILYLPRPLAEFATEAGVELDQLEQDLQRHRETLRQVRNQRVRPVVTTRFSSAGTRW